MKIKLVPQIRDESKIWYDISEDVVIATINNITDTFDFKGMPDGKLILKDLDGTSLVETVLDEVPIISASKTKGMLYVELLFSIDLEETDRRLLFPEWLSLAEFSQLMSELAKRKESKRIKLAMEKESEKRQVLANLELEERRKAEEIEIEKLTRQKKQVHELKDWNEF